MSVPCQCGGDHEPWQHPDDVRFTIKGQPAVTVYEASKLFLERLPESDPMPKHAYDAGYAEAVEDCRRYIAVFGHDQHGPDAFTDCPVCEAEYQVRLLTRSETIGGGL